MIPRWLPESHQIFWAANKQDLFRSLIVGEAENQSWLGKLAVAHVALNRARFASLSGLPWFDPVDWRCNILARYQFSCFWADYPVRLKALDLAVRFASRYIEADAAARAALSGEAEDPTFGADHYYNPESCPTPAWALPAFDRRGKLVRPPFTLTVAIGAHWFFSSWF
jgi:spore germination cell wall hydrolase CwlJ-like protein